MSGGESSMRRLRYQRGSQPISAWRPAGDGRRERRPKFNTARKVARLAIHAQRADGLRQFLASLVNESSTEVNSTMTRIPKVLLAVSLTAFAVGSVAAFGNPEIPVGWA